MRVVSINVAQPREVEWKGMLVSTGIFKEPVAGRLLLRRLNLEGDRQADLAVHGGPEKAAYGYPAEHYDFWRRELPGVLDWGWGKFGENFTTEGATEDELRIGDVLRVGSARVMVTQPRTPCYKLAMKFGRDDMIKRFLESARSGFYFSVVEEGEVGAGDVFERLTSDPASLSVADVNRLYVRDKGNRELLQRAIQLKALPEGWRNHFARRLQGAS